MDGNSFFAVADGVGDRLLSERKRLGLSQSDVGEGLGVDYKTVARLEKGSELGVNKIEGLAKMGFNIPFVLTGKLVTLPTSSDANALKNQAAETNVREKGGSVTGFSPQKTGDEKPPTLAVLQNERIEETDSYDTDVRKTANAGGFARTRTPNLTVAENVGIYSVPDAEIAPRGVSVPPVLEGYVFVPVLDIEASSGRGRFLSSENITEYIPFSLNELVKNNLNPKNLVGARSKGDSMVPTLPEKGLFVYDESQTGVDGGIFFFLYREEFYIKRLIREGASLRVISDNPTYPAWMIDDVENCHVIGKKVWHEKWGS
jgi:S24 (lexA) family peptidase